MTENDIKMVLEAVLITASEPLTVDKLIQAFHEWQRPPSEAVLKGLALLEQDYQNRAFELKNLASGYVIKTKAIYGPWIANLQLEKPGKYSRVLLETLAIIAYKQPVTRADIEEIRGVVVSSQMIKTLLEREWIRVAGHRDVPGKPAVYATTKEFLDYFNLKHLNDLPELKEVSLNE